MGGSEYAALIVATLVFTIVLVSCFMCIQLYHLRKPAPPSCGACGGDSSIEKSKERFLGAFHYGPACGSEWLHRRRDCRGVTSGVMPVIETATFGDGLCCGGLLP